MSDDEGDLPIDQLEINATPMEAAISAAVQSSVMPGDDMPTPEAIAEARLKAEQMINNEDSEGLRHLHNLTLSMGLPATRDLYHQMLAASGLRGKEKKLVERRITDFSPVTEIGCMRIDFHDKLTNTANVAHVRLGECPKNYDLSTQLDKLRGRVAEEKWTEVLRCLSTMIHLGRSVYAKISQDNKDLLRILAPDRYIEFAELKVDRDNTTLYLDSDWPNRVGIFIEF